MSGLRSITLLICVATSGNLAWSQSGACALPDAPRIWLLIQNQQAAGDPAPSPQLAALSKRLIDADTKFRDQLAQRLPANSCIVTSGEIFDDPKNFPQLKGSTIVEISADASSKSPGVAALAVTVTSVGGAYVQDDFRMFTIPILIETESDYARGADGLMKFWQAWVDAATHRRNK
ncbi:MAG: hypothetical protein WCF17_12030 [Terracidiphilus sp.]